MDNWEFADDELCRNLDQALAKKMNSQTANSRGVLVRRLYPVIQKYRRAGMTLKDIVDCLQEEGYDLNRGHLIWHLGQIEKKKENPPSTPMQAPKSLPIEQTPKKNPPLTHQEKPLNSNLKLVESKTDNLQNKKESPFQTQPIYTPEDPLILEGSWITGQPVLWWEFQTNVTNPCIPAPLPMPLRYPLPQSLRPEKMPEKPTDWTFIDIDPAAGDHYNLPLFPNKLPRGYAPTRWWCYRYPRQGNLSAIRLYSVLPGCDPEAPYGRYPDGRPYKKNGKVWGIGPNVRQQATLHVIPPGEPNTVDLFFSMIPDQEMAYSWKIVKLPDWEQLYQAWCIAAEQCGIPTELQ